MFCFLLNFKHEYLALFNYRAGMGFDVYLKLSVKRILNPRIAIK
jgi:hypothetical protein